MLSLAAILEFPKYYVDKSDRSKMERGVIHMLRKVMWDLKSKQKHGKITFVNPTMRILLLANT